MYTSPIAQVSLISIDRTQKVKDARSEAAKEVEAYKAQKQKDFKQFESEVNSLEQVDTDSVAYWFQYSSRTGCEKGRRCEAQGN